MTIKWGRVGYGTAGIAALAALIWAFVPDPLAVDVAAVRRGLLQVTVDEDGETRARDRYVISAPVAGRVTRIDLREGDAVAAGQIVANLLPLPLSARERDEQLARIAAAEALSREADARVRHAQADLEQARRERARVDKLVSDGFMSPQAAEQALVMETTQADELAAARFRARSAAADAKAARAALMAIGDRGRQATVPLRSPVAGRVFSISERSERIVAAGTALLVLGDPHALEVVVDVLSRDAVRIRPGMTVLLEGWGGPTPLQARVRLVEPYAFTKVSALGVEEQRVNVIADFVDPPQGLGHGFRVEARIVVWSGAEVLKSPSSALFRRGDGWAVFVAAEGRARLREVTTGQRTPLETEIVAGLQPDQRVVLHPASEMADGARIRVRD